jgi:hypothetical protein
MKIDRSRLLVIDASIAQSSGETEHPVSKICREALNCILKICHHIILTRTIREEWKHHKSKFARKWLCAMYARKKIKNIEDAALPEVTIKQSNVSQNDLIGLEKDLPLIQGACAGDGIIITRDEEITKIWSRCREHIKTPQFVRWINPVHDGTECLKDL